MTQSNEKSQLVITRELDAPAALVFQAWTDPEMLAKWWGPKGSAIKVNKFELEPGGTFHYCMDHPNGQEMWGLFSFREILPPTRLTFVSSFSDAEGNITRGPFFPNWPLEILNIITLEEKEGKTTLTLTGGPINANEDELQLYASIIPSMEQGFGGSFDQLEEYLKTLG